MRKTIRPACTAVIKLCIFLLFCSCGSGGGASGAGSTSAIIQNIPLENVNGVNGNGNIIVASYTDTTTHGGNTGFKETLKIYQQDSTNPDLLLNLSSVYLGVDTLYHGVPDITLNSQWATITMNDTDLGANDGWVALVSLSGPNYTLAATLAFNATLDRSVAADNWLLVASSTDLELYSIATPTAPVLTGLYTLSSTTTSMVALPHGFFVITNNGYAYLNTSDPLNITFSETADSDIKQSKSAYLIGNKLYIGGPSKYAGKIKIARVDLTTPSSPAVDIINDQIDGNLNGFSYDGGEGYYVETFDKVMQYKDAGGVLGLNKEVSSTSYSRSGASQFYSWNGRYYTAVSGFNVCRMP